MAAPSVPTQFPLPSQGMVPTTYPDYIKKLECKCPGGALIKPSPLPSATKNLGDVIASQAGILSAFTSVYGMITVILRMISCIIDVLCSLTNPFAMIAAIIKLFGSCLPDLLSIFPQLAVPTIILCIIKIILAIVEYILTVIVPLIEEIINNVNRLIDAVLDNNQDAQVAIAFKIVSLFKELQNILGILAALGAIWEMIKILLKLGIGIPCSGAGGSCSGCGDDECPNTLKESTLTGTDGVLTVINTFDPPLINLYSSSKVLNFIEIKDFFPLGLNYDSITDNDRLPYVMEIGSNQFAVTGVDNRGNVSLAFTQASYSQDGYLFNTDMAGNILPTTDARFYTPTGSLYVNYINLKDTRGLPYSTDNNGTQHIINILNEHNVYLQKTGTWSYTTNPLIPDIDWSISPLTGSGQSFTLDIHHDELIRYNLIGLGCHPAVHATLVATTNRFPQLADGPLPDLPDLDALISNLNNCITNVAPLNLTSEWVLNNYQTIALNMPALQSCVTNLLNNFKNNMTDYAKNILDRILDLELSEMNVTPLTQTIGQYININIIPLDRSGAVLTLGLPPGSVAVDVFATQGTLAPVEEVLDAYGASTGVFITNLGSYTPIVSQISADIDGYAISDFNGSVLERRYVDVQFVAPSKPIFDGSSEPMGKGIK